MRPGGARRYRGARGFTVIEVLVALVVLLIGVYAMIRIFPRSYTAVEASQMRTTASQLAEAELAYWKLHPESLPDQVVATDYQGNVIESTQIGTPSDANGTGTMAPLLVLPQAHTSLLPGSSTYDTPVIAGDLFLNVGQVAGAIYSPADLTPSQVNAVAGLPDPSTGRAQLVPNPGWQPNSMYLPRTIIGEQVDIRRLTTTATGVPFHLLSQAPLDVLRSEDDPATPAVEQNKVWVDVYDARPWQYVAWGTQTTLRLEQGEFTYDPQAERLEFGPRADDGVSTEPHDRQFKVDYTALGHFRNLVRIFGETVVVPGGTGQASDKLARGLADPQSLRVYEKLIPATAADDPQDVSPTARRNIYWVDPQTEITGAIRFPQVLLVNPLPTDITLVKVDYRVKDWRILSFDVQVPSSGVVELPIKGIKGSSFIDLPRQPRPEPVGRGLRVLYKPDGTIDPRAASDPVTWAFVVAVDLQNGEVLTERISSAYPNNPYMRRTSLPRVNYREGRIQFNYFLQRVIRHGRQEFTFDPHELSGSPLAGVDTPDRSGRTYRIYCRAENDWAVQLTMAARLYGRSSTGLPGGPPVGATGALLSYAWDPVVDPRQLYFPLSEAAQTVAVDYYDQDGNFIDGETHTVGAATVVRFPGATGAPDVYAWMCPLVLPLDKVPKDFGPITVRGISVRARAAWMSNGRRATLQDVAAAVKVAVGGRVRPPRKSLEETWHQVLLDGYVTRTPI
jgi:prepilin-type N-terminal cleavage/methylation domain-containing protein